MNVPTPRRRPRTDVDMVPMINFAFLLLIFFMLVGRFGPLDPFPVAPPRAAAGPVEIAPETEVLLLGADGALAFGRERIGASGLAARAIRWKLAHPAQALPIKADAAADAARLVELLETLRAAGVAEVRLMTRPAGAR